MKFQNIIFSIVLICMLQISYTSYLGNKLGLKESKEVTITEDNFEEIIQSSIFDYSNIKIVVGERMNFSSEFESFLYSQTELKHFSYEDKNAQLKELFFPFLLNSINLLKNLDTLSLNDCKLSLVEASDILNALKTDEITNLTYLNLENNLIFSNNQELDDTVQFYEYLYCLNVKFGIKINLSNNNSTDILSLIDLFLIYQESPAKNLVYKQGSLDILATLLDYSKNPSEIIDLSNKSEDIKLLIELHIFSNANISAREINISGNTFTYDTYLAISKLITNNTQRLILSNTSTTSPNELLRLFEPKSLSLNYIDLTNIIFNSSYEFISLMKEINRKVNDDVKRIIVKINDANLIKLSKKIKKTTRIRLQVNNQIDV